jgi:predicted dehydrogenase
MGISIGMCGVGAFAECFIPLFKAHPEVERVVLCDLDEEKLRAKSEKFGIRDTCPSLDDLCGTDVDAIAIITQHHLHGPQAVQALRAGKHVYSAVPSALTYDEMAGLVRTVEATRKLYMIGETSYYYPCAIYCRERFQRGDFGDVVYGEGEYYHDMSHGIVEVMKERHGADWKRYINWPPLYYPTHSVSMVVSVTGAHATHVSALGIEDRDPDRLYHQPDPVHENHFSNETMLCTMSDGSVARFNEFRRIGHPGTVRLSLFGTRGSYEQHTGSKIWVTRDPKETEDITDRLAIKNLPAEGGGTYTGVSRIHPVDRLPRSFVGLPNDHLGSHQFLVDDFVRACVTGTLPPNNVWQAARYLLPGLVGHASAMRGGILLQVPDFGDAPAGLSPTGRGS